MFKLNTSSAITLSFIMEQVWVGLLLLSFSLYSLGGGEHKRNLGGVGIGVGVGGGPSMQVKTQTPKTFNSRCPLSKRAT